MKKMIIAFMVMLMIVPAAKGSVSVIDNLYRQCDVNRDGYVTSADVTAIYDYLLGNGGSWMNNDVNHDGFVTSADVTFVYDVLLNGGEYNSISDAFALNLECLDIDDVEHHDLYHFYWDDVATGNGVSVPDYLLLLSTDPSYIDFYCVHVGTNEYNMASEEITDWLQYKFHWNNPEDVPEQVHIYARVELLISGKNDVLISNVLEFDFVPHTEYQSSKPIHLWWLTGSFVATNHWENMGPLYGGFGRVPMFPVQGATYNSNGEGPLEYYGYFPAGGEFKIIEEPGRWDYVIGGGDENGGQVYSGNCENIHINQGGYYKIDLNTVDKTMTMTRLADDQASFSTITMPGGYQDWNVTGNAMTALAPTDNHDWYALFTLDTDTEMKFAAGNWDYNWGGIGFPFGQGVQDGANIPVKAGIYHVYFNDLSGDFMFIDEECGLPSSNYLLITKNMEEYYIDLTADINPGTKIKLCDIVTTIDGYYMLCFDNEEIEINRDGTVDLFDLKQAVLGTYYPPRTGGCVLGAHVRAQSGNVTIKSNEISIPVVVENYSIVIADTDERIDMILENGLINYYKAIIPAGNGDIRFKIAPESSSAEYDMITPPSEYDSEETYGTFDFGNPGYFKIPYDAAYSEYEVSLNFNDKTYTIVGKEKSSMIWQVGNANNWGATSPPQGLSMNFNGTHTGYMFLNGAFLFRENYDNWNGSSWGTDNYNSALSGNLVVNGSTLTAPQGFYKVDVDLNYLTYNLTTISSVSLIGSAVPTGSQWATDLDLTYNQSSCAWEGTYVLNSGDYKIRANHNWYLNWGGTNDNLVPDGANLTISQPGPYLVQVFLTYNGDSHIALTRQ